MTDLKNKLEKIENSFTPSDLSYIHYNSAANFIFHFNEIKNPHVRSEIIRYFNLYFDKLNDDVSVDRSLSNYLYETIIQKVGSFYNVQLGFKLYSNLKFELFYSLIIDLIFLVSGVLKNIYFIPPATTIVLIRYIYLLKYKRAKKLYGYRF